MTDEPTPRQLSDRYVDSLIALDPVTATGLGLPDGADRLGDPSPSGFDALEDLRVATLTDLDALEAAAAVTGGVTGEASRDLPVGPAQVDAVVEQLGRWLAAGGGVGWYHQLAGQGPEPVRAARYWTGADVDLHEAYAWAWGEFARLDGEPRAEAERVLPGAGVRAAMHHLDTDGPVIEGVDAVLEYLQGLMDGAIAALDGVHFDLAEPIKRVEAMLAPEGSAAAPYYTRPSLDIARPGRTWLPTLGRTRFPRWDLVSTWYTRAFPAIISSSRSGSTGRRTCPGSRR